MTACSSTNYAIHKIKETPTFTRQALIYDTHVVIVTRTTLTPEQYTEMRANSNVNK
jgi:hypothetical protein